MPYPNSFFQEDKKSKNIFDQYGSGIKAYFKFLRTLIGVYLVLSLMVAPIGYIYASHEGLYGMENYWITRFSMGNLGFAETLCYNQLYQFKGNKQIRCRTGVLAQELTFSGLLPNTNITSKKDSSKMIYHNFCGNTSEHIETLDSCPLSYDKEKLN
jgi:hypothetical protein